MYEQVNCVLLLTKLCNYCWPKCLPPRWNIISYHMNSCLLNKYTQSMISMISVGFLCLLFLIQRRICCGSEIINHACTLAWERQDTAALTRCCVITCNQRDLWQRRHRISFPPKFPPEPPTFPHTSFALLLSPPSSISPVLGPSHFPPYKTTFMASTEGAL